MNTSLEDNAVTTVEPLSFVWYPVSRTVPDWAKGMNNYTVRFYRGTDTANACDFDYFKGLALTEPPTQWEVLETLISDYYTVANGVTFEDWATDLGYDTDSRKAYATYEQILDNSRKLLSLITLPEVEQLWVDFQKIEELA
jgi:hypothetical protein